MTQRKYTIAELDQMRRALSMLLADLGAEGIERYQVWLLIEVRLQTCLLNGTEPEELEAEVRALEE
jgi:hypothetical protein